MKKAALCTCILLSLQGTAQQHAFKNITAKDFSKYSAYFLKKLAADSVKHYILEDSLFIVGSDTSYFPTDIPTGKFIQLVGCRDDNCYSLRLKRINYTTVEYELAITRNWKQTTTEEGNITLGAGFYLASEIDEDQNGNAYSSIAYYGKGKQCSLTVRVGSAHGAVLVKLSRACADKKEDIPLHSSPLLWEK
ncbi:MAG: hypothetical protein K0Q66_1660 [Chitinophagaceae bacterium]|nr:hypothetical protein [Chitinophagaceae bacterium]